MKCKVCNKRQAPPGFDVCECCTVEEYFRGREYKTKKIFPCPQCAKLKAVLTKILEAHEMSTVDWPAMREAKKLVEG